MNTRTNRRPKSVTQWFVEPLDKFTNEAIASLLAGRGDPSDAEMHGLEDAEGSLHNLWQVDHGVITNLDASKTTTPLFYKIWFRHGNRGAVSLWRFPRRQVPKPVKASALAK